MSQLIFVCNFVKNQQIVMPYSLLDFKVNCTCALRKSKHRNCNITAEYCRRKSHQCITSSSKWTRVVCLISAYFNWGFVLDMTYTVSTKKTASLSMLKHFQNWQALRNFNLTAWISVSFQ